MNDESGELIPDSSFIKLYLPFLAGQVYPFDEGPLGEEEGYDNG